MRVDLSKRAAKNRAQAWSSVAVISAALFGGVSPAFGDFFTVFNANDSGAGSLRAAIEAANADVTPPHTIDFEIPGSGPFVIPLATALPTITRQTFITAFDEAIGGAPGVRIDGTALGTGNGLSFGAAADGSGVAYLSITHFPGYGINIASDTTSVTNCYIGVLPDGVTAGGNDLAGVFLTGLQATVGSTSTSGNVISGNAQSGIVVTSTAGFSVIRGNRIGTNAEGTTAIANGGDGISGSGAGGTNVGGNTPGHGNLISGNGSDGIDLASSAEFWAVQGNVIGLTADGLTALPNGQNGIFTTGDNHLIGSTDPNGRNVISGNLANGIMLFSGSESVGIRGNYIGTNVTGTAGIGNQVHGIRATGTVFACIVGGSDAAWRNVVSGNVSNGISVEADTAQCEITANYIGTNAAGTAAIANGGGVDLGGSGTELGGDTAGQRNVISGNNSNGVVLRGSNNVIKGNYVGLNAAGTAAIPNASDAIRAIGATGGLIGGNAPTDGNVISGNTASGITLDNDTSNIGISGNFIGTNPAGSAAIANGGSGVVLGGTGQTLGGPVASLRNVISGNQFQGVVLGGSGNGVQGNYIGTDATGTAAIPNGTGGVRAIGATGGAIGGIIAGRGNLISGNGSNGITLDPDTTQIGVFGNLVGTNAAGTAALANAASGIVINGTFHTVGGQGSASNLVSGNAQNGIVVHGSGHHLRGNYIGTNAAGTAAVANGGIGIRVLDATMLLIGGTLLTEGNLISGNGSSGMSLESDAVSNEIVGNRIGTDSAGIAAVPNQGSGVDLDGSNNLLGGNTAGSRNVISGNLFQGVVLSGTDNWVRGNYIGTNAAGTAALGNGSYGVRIYAATDGTVGGSAAADGNLISGNERGVSLEFGTTGAIIKNNTIGLDVTQTINLADDHAGIQVDTSDNVIGGPGAGNVIAGMSQSGIELAKGASGNYIQGNWLGTNKVLAAGLGNHLAGVWVHDAYGNFIGGAGAGQANIIMHNGFMGVRVERGDDNEITANSIQGNGLLGIDVGKQYVFPNDPLDPDLVGNRAQNFPLVTSATNVGGDTHIEGQILNEPATDYRIELFSSPSCDETGFGEGGTYLGFLNRNTDAAGESTFSIILDQQVADPFVTATVVDNAGNTSEFSPCAEVGGPNPGQIQFFRDVYLAYEGVINTAEVILTRSHGLEGTVTVTLSTSNDSAQAGADYVDSDQVVTFQPLEAVKVVNVPLIVDPAVEPSPENVLLSLSAPGGGATLGLDTSEILIFDEDKANPGIIIDDASTTEGNAGQKQLTFDVHLSATDHPVTVAFQSEPGSALEGSDYVHVDGEIAFDVSNSTQAQQVSIPLIGDTSEEIDEIVWMRILSAPGGGNWIAYKTYGAGVIVNDDGVGPPPEVLFEDGFEDLP